MSCEAKVVGIPLTVDDDAIHDFFARFGPLADMRREGAEEVIIAFENAEDLADALQVSEFEDGAKITIVRVEPAPATAPVPETAAAEPASAEDVVAVEAVAEGGPVTLAAVAARTGRDAHKLRVSDLPREDVSAALREMFGKCGEISDFFYRPGGAFAFVGLNSSESVVEALKLHKTELNGKALCVELKRIAGDRKDVRAPREAGPSRNLERRVVLKSIGSASDAAIRELFASCGEITDFYVNRRSDVCFLEFATKDAHSAAIAKTGSELAGHRVTVEPRSSQRCFHCNQEGHIAARCPTREIICRDCGRPGHMARDCPSARGGRVRSSRGGDRDSRRHRRSRSRSDSRDRRRRHRRDDSDSEDDRPRGGDRRRSRRHRSRSLGSSRSPSRSRSPARKSRRRDRSRTPPRPRN